MPIIVVCPGCSTKLSAPEEVAGKQVRCPKCGSAADVPAFVAVEEVPVVEAAVVSPKPKPKPVKADEEEDETPRKKKRRDEEDEDEDRPRKKKKRAYVDDDDEEDYARSKRRRARGGGGGSGVGVIIAISLGAVLVLGGIGFAIWAIAGKGSPFAKKTPVPEGWKEYSYPTDGFKAYFPKEPQVMTMTADGFPMGGMGMGGVGGGGGFPGTAEIREIESVSAYTCGQSADGIVVAVTIARFRNEVPKSMRDQLRHVRTMQHGEFEFRSVRWLGFDAAEVTTKSSLMRIVYTDRLMIHVQITGGKGTRAKPEEEEAFFDNFELTK
ncbi:MAG: zinc-ribbon domain-containing protein [Planctomycetia bacterium]|nr:zinc-ribbon domain-containing protein [Planctomycetia bacterium]